MNAYGASLFIQLYWFSLVLIGYAFVQIVFKWGSKYKTVRGADVYFSQQHVVTKILLSFAITFFLFSVLSPLLYVTHAQPKVASLIYLLLLSIAVIYVVYSLCRRVLKVERWDLLGVAKQNNLTKLVMLLTVLLLIGDYLFALYVRSFSDGDAIYHMARVLDVLHSGFNVQTSFMSNLREGAYHYNSVYTLYVIPSKLFSLEPMQVWEYSLSFFRLMMWLSVAVLAGYAFDRWLRLSIPKTLFVSLTVIATIAAMADDFFIANYPNQLVYIWMILYIILLDYFPRPSKPQAILLFVVGYITTMTHPTYALSLVGLTGLYLATKLVLRRLDSIKELLYFAPGITALLVGPVLTLLVPGEVTEVQKHLNDPIMTTVGSLKFINPAQDLPVDVAGWIVLVATILTAAYLLILQWRKNHWPLLFAVFAFYPLLAYTPLFSLLNHLLPAWVVRRFISVNILVYLSISLAVVILLQGIVRMQRTKKITALKKGNVHILLVCTVIIISSVVIIPSYTAFNRYRFANISTYSYQEAIRDGFSEFLTDNKVVLANPKDSYLLTANFPIDVVAVEQGHFPLAAAINTRIECQDRLLKSFEFSDLKASKVSYIAFPIIQAGKSESQRAVAVSKPYIYLLATGPHYYIYGFNGQELAKATTVDTGSASPCALYGQEEKK